MAAVRTKGDDGAVVEHDHSHFDIGIDLRIGWFVSRDGEEKEAERGKKRNQCATQCEREKVRIIRRKS